MLIFRGGTSTTGPPPGPAPDHPSAALSTYCEIFAKYLRELQEKSAKHSKCTTDFFWNFKELIFQ